MHVTLRLRPYIIGLSDDYPQLIHEASLAGADSMQTEFFCLETRVTPELEDKYREISKVVGYDICYEYLYSKDTFQTNLFLIFLLLLSTLKVGLV